jgi:hypothetical protein
MKKIRVWSLLFAAVFGSGLSNAWSQTTVQPKAISESSVGIIYDNEWTAQARLITRGFGLGFHWGEIETYYKTNIYSAHLDFFRHIKQSRQNTRPSIYNSVARPFAYGKQNSFFSLKAGMGSKRYFSEKARQRGLAIGLTYQGGIALGFEKPYYLEVLNDGDFTQRATIDIKYEEETADQFLDLSRIQGASGFFKGLGEANIIPGLHGRIELNFAWGAFEEDVRSLDVGLLLEIYPRTIELMINDENAPYFLHFYVNFQLGKRL